MLHAGPPQCLYYLVAQNMGSMRDPRGSLGSRAIVRICNNILLEKVRTILAENSHLWSSGEALGGSGEALGRLRGGPGEALKAPWRRAGGCGTCWETGRGSRSLQRGSGRLQEGPEEASWRWLGGARRPCSRRSGDILESSEAISRRSCASAGGKRRYSILRVVL